MSKVGERIYGLAGEGVEVLYRQRKGPGQATVACWFLDCPLQSPAWRHYLLAVVHLRPIPGVDHDAEIRVPHATHEVIEFGLDPSRRPRPDRPKSWRQLHPINVCEQVELPNDEAAVMLARSAAIAVVGGVLPAEPPLSGQVEPWRTSMIRTSAHIRGEAHAS